jgi:hypothetical protein
MWFNVVSLMVNTLVCNGYLFVYNLMGGYTKVYTKLSCV